jgi:Phytanoyl-CoA dioxygenase (PhyH)
MAANQAPARKPEPLERLYGRMTGALGILGSKIGASSAWGKARRALQGAHPNQFGAGKTDSRPRNPILQVTALGEKPVEAGLAAIWGWAYSAEADFPEGSVEVALDDENKWVVLTNRIPGGSNAPDESWYKRCGFHAALNTFLLSNGVHRARLRVKTRSGRVAATSEVTFRVNNVGRLAEFTSRLMRESPRAKRILADLIDIADFPDEQASAAAWFDRADAEDHIASIMARHSLPAVNDARLRQFVREGYLVLENFISRDHCERINRDLDDLIKRGVFKYEFKGQRVEKLFEHSESTRSLWAHPEILKMVSAIFDDKAVPCQTLNFLHGSQQAVHQDVIHLTPFPQGFMCGVWVALEDIHADAGPLIVYPGSHRLPRLYCRTVGVEKVRESSKWNEFSAQYAPRVKELIDQSGLEPVYYTPKAGSVLIWHENLAHGGSPRNNDELTRKSIVSHYFARGAVAFYDSQGTPAGSAPPDDD